MNDAARKPETGMSGGSIAVLNVDSHALPRLAGTREIGPEDFYLPEDAAEWMEEINGADCGWSYLLSAACNVDEVFGTCVETDENDDYINIYAYVNPGYDAVEDYLTVILCKGDGDIVEYRRDLSNAEQAVVLGMVQKYEMERLKQELAKAHIERGETGMDLPPCPSLLNLKDGSAHTLFEFRQFLDLVDVHMGMEAAQFLKQHWDELEQMADYTTAKMDTDLEAYETQLESNQQAFEEIKAKVIAITALLQKERLNRKKIANALWELEKIIAKQI